MASTLSGSDDDVISGINVTPLVDVVLVLLVIFLITAPVIYQSAIKVKLPKAVTGQTTQQSPLSFTINREGALSWGSQPVAWNELQTKITAFVKISGDPSELTALITADENTAHGVVIRLMDALRENGIGRFALSVQSSHT